MTRNPGVAFPWSDKEIHNRVQEAIRAHWRIRADQVAKQMVKAKENGGSVDAGTRNAVTGGKHLDPFCHLLTELAHEAGFSEDEVRFTTGLVLPGYYRPTKKWDLVVVRRGELHAAIELKSMSGSVGNNMNNRSEEVLGAAHDFWQAFDAKLLGPVRPFLGYLFILGDDHKSRAKVGLSVSEFKPDSAFDGNSYIDRYGLLCERMVEAGLYNAAAYLASVNAGTGQYSEPRPKLTFATFAKALYGHLARVS